MVQRKPHVLHVVIGIWGLGWRDRTIPSPNWAFPFLRHYSGNGVK